MITFCVVLMRDGQIVKSGTRSAKKFKLNFAGVLAQGEYTMLVYPMKDEAVEQKSVYVQIHGRDECSRISEVGHEEGM